MPDLNMIGYLWNTKIGEYAYNAIHSLILPVAFLCLYLVDNSEFILILSLVLFTHILNVFII